MSQDIYSISKTLKIGNDSTVCQSCVENISETKKISKTKAARDLYGKFTGKKMIHIGNIMICEQCLKKFYNEFFNIENELNIPEGTE